MGIVRRKLLLVSIGMPIRDIQYFNVEGNCLLSCHPIQWGVLYDTETRIIYSHMLLECVGPENDFIHSFPWRVYCFMDPYFPFNIRPSDNLLRISYNLPWCRHGYFLEPSIGSKCTFTFNKAVLTVSFVGKIPCIVTIVRIGVLCFLVFIIKCCSCPRWVEFGYPVSNQNNVIFPTLTSNLNQNILIPYM